MHTLTTAVDTTDTTGAFETTMSGKVWVHVVSTFGGGTVTMQKSIDKGANWGIFYPDGVAETFTAETTKLYNLPGGWYFRLLNDSSAAATTGYVEGPHIRVNVYDPNAVDSA
jgi:hypothetical protein